MTTRRSTRSRVARAVLLVAACAVVAAPLWVVAAPREARHTEPATRAQRGLDGVEQQLLVLINRHRARTRLPPLRAVSVLNDVAHAHSVDMGRRHFFSHASPDGRSPFDRMRNGGYRGGAMAENIAAGNADGLGTFRQWRTSPGHNRNMLGRQYRAIGLGRAAAPSGDALGYYWTACFGDVVQ